MHLNMQAILGHILKRTVEKNQTNATNVTMHPQKQAIWGDIWKCIVEKSQTNATNVTLHLLGQAIWGHTCYTKIPKNTGILFSKIPVSVFEFNPGIPVFSGIPQGPGRGPATCQFVSSIPSLTWTWFHIGHISGCNNVNLKFIFWLEYVATLVTLDTLSTCLLYTSDAADE